MRRSLASSVTRTAAPSSTRSRPAFVLQPVVRTVFGFCSRFLAFGSLGPVQKHKASSSQTAMSAVTCGRPSVRTVEIQYVKELRRVYGDGSGRRAHVPDLPLPGPRRVDSVLRGDRLRLLVPAAAANPYAVVVRDDIQIHLFGLDDFDPAASHGNVIIVVPDPDGLYQAFAAGLRHRYGRLPSSGIPRILRPRRRLGTVRGFSVVNPGGNWLRIPRLRDTEEDAPSTQGHRPGRVIDHAAGLGDAKGDNVAAMEILVNGLARFPDASAVDRVQALVYHAELAIRMDDQARAEASLQDAKAVAIDLTDDERASTLDEVAHAKELVRGAG